MTASAEGPAHGGAAEPVCNRRLLGRMANLARADLGKVPTLRLAAGLSARRDAGELLALRLDLFGSLQNVEITVRDGASLGSANPRYGSAAC